ncbi:TICRR protein, partial [Atlantisia rogersi]|nr:TICRR protein [Atlantisia rogersi]
SSAVKPSPGKRRTRKDSLHLEELAACQTPRKTPHKLAQKVLNSASKLPRRSPRILHRTPQKLEKTPGRSPAAKQSATKCLGKYFSHPVQRVKSPSVLTECKRVHSLEVASKDCSPPERLSPPCKEAGLQIPEHDGFAVLSASLLPLTDSNPAASSPSAVQKRCFTEMQTPRRSLRYLSRLTSPLGTRRQILRREIEAQSDPLPQITKGTLRKPEDPGSKLLSSPLSAEIPQLVVRLEPLFSSSLCESSRNTLAISSPMQARESDCKIGASKPSLQISPGITGTSLRSLLHTLEKANCEPNSGGENLITLRSATPPENDSHDSSGNSSVESLQLCQSQLTENAPVLKESTQMDVVLQKSPREDLENLEKHFSPQLSAEGQVHAQNAEVECEQQVKEGNSSANTCESSLSGSQTVRDDLDPRTLLREEYMGLKSSSLKRHSKLALGTLPPLPKSAPAYSLRCTADRRQREAAARMGNPQLLAKFPTPKSHCKLPSAASPPTYEVELEMQASGLPKLRIKKIGSCSSLEVQPEASASKPKGGESPFSDLAVTWCSKHPGKPAAACVSPSCFHSFHSTPGKGGGQTYICQSYTPTSCASNTTSPSPLEAGVPWTPSPKQKGKTTPDAINDWPRRKRAAGSTANPGCGQPEKNADEQKRTSGGRGGEMKISEHYSSKVTSNLGEFELEGICRLQDQPSPSGSEPRADEDFALGTFGLKSRKRVLMCLSPEKENRDAKRSCSDRGNLDLAGFSIDEGDRSKSRMDSVLPEKPGACMLITPEQHSCAGGDDVFLFSGN